MEVIVAYCKALAWRFPGETEENHKEFQEFQGLVCPLGF